MIRILAFSCLLAASVAPESTYRAFSLFAERLAFDIGAISQAHTDKKAFPFSAILTAAARTFLRLLLLIVLFNLIVVDEIITLRHIGFEKLVGHPFELKNNKILAEKTEPAATSTDKIIDEKPAADDANDPVVVLGPAAPIVRRPHPVLAPLKLVDPIIYDDDDDDDDDVETETPARAVRAVRPPSPPFKIRMPEDEDVTARPNVAVRAVRPSSPPMKLSRSMSSSTVSSRVSRSFPTRTISSPAVQTSQTEPLAAKQEKPAVRPVEKRASVGLEPSYAKKESVDPAVVLPVPAIHDTPAEPAQRETTPSHAKPMQDEAPATAPVAPATATEPAEPAKKLSNVAADLPTPPVTPTTSTTNQSTTSQPLQKVPTHSSSPQPKHSSSLSSLAHKITHPFDHATSSDSDSSEEKDGKKHRLMLPFGAHKDGEPRGTRTVKRLVRKLKGEAGETEE